MKPPNLRFVHVFPFPFGGISSSVLLCFPGAWKAKWWSSQQNSATIEGNISQNWGEFHEKPHGPMVRCLSNQKYWFSWGYPFFCGLKLPGQCFFLGSARYLFFFEDMVSIHSGLNQYTIYTYFPSNYRSSLLPSCRSSNGWSKAFPLSESRHVKKPFGFSGKQGELLP